MSIDEKSRNICLTLIEQLPEKRRKAYQSLMEYHQMTYIDEIHHGLTMLAISCMELGALFSRFEQEEEVRNHLSIVRRMTVGYLFEVYNSLWRWIGQPAKQLCESRSLPVEHFVDEKKRVDCAFSRYVPLLKVIRNSAFHTKDAGDKEWATTATGLLFEKQVPQRLWRCLYEYGYNINVVANRLRIYGCYPGIGGFGAINPATGQARPMQNLYWAGTNVKVTPDPA